MITSRQHHLSQGLAHISRQKEQQASMPSSIQGASQACPLELRPYALAHMHECGCRQASMPSSIWGASEAPLPGLRPHALAHMHECVCRQGSQGCQCGSMRCKISLSIAIYVCAGKDHLVVSVGVCAARYHYQYQYTSCVCRQGSHGCQCGSMRCKRYRWQQSCGGCWMMHTCQW